MNNAKFKYSQNTNYELIYQYFQELYKIYLDNSKKI